jgi:hypothetical protein
MCEQGSSRRMLFGGLALIVGVLCIGRVAGAENIAGNWYASENATIQWTASYLGETDQWEQPISGSGTAAVTQNSNNIQWHAPGTNYLRSGTIVGRNIQASGILCALSDVPFPGTFTYNLLTANGTLSTDNTTINLTGTGSCQGYGTYEGSA